MIQRSRRWGGTRWREPRWPAPLREVRGQGRTTVDRRNDLANDGPLIPDRDWPPTPRRSRKSNNTSSNE
jgi:hypothetical protein